MLTTHGPKLATRAQQLDTLEHPWSHTKHAHDRHAVVIHPLAALVPFYPPMGEVPRQSACWARCAMLTLPLKRSSRAL